jgi:polysaccharide export outer membrane protein
MSRDLGLAALLRRSAALVACGVLVSCSALPPPTAPTAVNPPTFPQPVPATPPLVDELPEFPSPPAENGTFTTINGVPLYRIGRGDVLDLTILRGAVQDKLTATVRSNGTIFVILAEVEVDGLTAEQAARKVAQDLAVFFRNPVVDVQVKEYHSKKVTVVGSVGSSTRMSGVSLPLTGRTTVAEIIGKAGGFHPNANLERIRVTRASGETYSVNMYRYVQDVGVARPSVLDSGDIVIVPELPKGAEERRVFLLGEVRTPGPVPLIPRMTLAQLVAQAGGWTENARFEEAAIIRPAPDSTEIILVDLRRLLVEGERRIDQYLRPNDVVYVPRTGIGNWNALLAKLRPTLEFLALPLQPVFTIKALDQ